MISLHSPKQKLLVATGALIAVIVAASAQGASAAVVARIILIVAGAGAIAWLATRRRASASKFELPPRLHVVSRAGLSQRCAVALIEADGRSYLVAYGDGFAEIRAERPAATRTQGRRPRRAIKRAGSTR